MKYAEKIFRKRFSAERSKDAFLKAAEWLAKNVISKKDEIGDFTFGIEKVKDSEQPTFELTLYVSLDEKEVMERHCKICEEVHKLFYVNEENNCNSCSVKAYRKRMEEAIKIKGSYIKSVVQRKRSFEDE